MTRKRHVQDLCVVGIMESPRVVLVVYFAWSRASAAAWQLVGVGVGVGVVLHIVYPYP